MSALVCGKILVSLPTGSMDIYRVVMATSRMRTDGTHVYPAVTRRGAGTRVVELFHWEAGNWVPPPHPRFSLLALQ